VKYSTTRANTIQEYLIRVKHDGDKDIYVGRRYADFVQLHKRIRMELPGKVLPPLPRKNNKDSLLSSKDDDDASSISSGSTQGPPPDAYEKSDGGGGGLRSYLWGGSHKKSASQTSLGRPRSPRASGENLMYQQPKTLYREEQRVSLRAFLRSFLHNERIAQSNAMADFLTRDPIEVNEEEMEDIERRMIMDEKRIKEQKQFYEVARKRAAELDIHMEKFRREIVESNGLSRLFQEIRIKNSISELKPEYQKFAEWLRIEVAATIYHLFLAEDNSPELFAQAKRIHSLVPYGMLKNVIRIANPAAVMSGVLDLFLAQPFGARSLLQRIFGMAINDGVNSVQKTIETLGSTKIKDDVLCKKIKGYVEASEDVKQMIRQEAESDQIDVVVTILRSDLIKPELSSSQVEKVFNAYVAWNNAVENVRSTCSRRASSSRSLRTIRTNASVQIDKDLRQGAELFAHLKQYLKLCLRQRDKLMMLQIIEEVRRCNVVILWGILTECSLQPFNFSGICSQSSTSRLSACTSLQTSTTASPTLPCSPTTPSRPSRPASVKRSLQTPTKQYRLLSICVNVTKATSTSLSTKCTNTTTVSLTSLWAGWKAFSNS
jgi:hypothetical protein